MQTGDQLVARCQSVDFSARLRRSTDGSQPLIFLISAVLGTLFGSTSFNFCRISRNSFSVVGQSMQASVTDTPYLSCFRSAGIDWLPAFILLSSIKPTIDRLPSMIWWAQSLATSGCRLWSLLELAWLQSTTILAGSLFFASSFSTTAIVTES